VIKNKFIKLFFKATIGISLFLWIAYTLYNQIIHQPNLQNTIHDLFVEWNTSKILFLSIVFILMIFNWTIEAQKWRLLLVETEKFSLWKSLQSILTGVAVSVITPNRIGEYMGRILYLRNVHKIQGITVTIIGSFAQLIITGFLGLIGVAYYILNVQNYRSIYKKSIVKKFTKKKGLFLVNKKIMKDVTFMKINFFKKL
jgi:uncharacterized membrane protein YbhN (UPF0104 family)